MTTAAPPDWTDDAGAFESLLRWYLAMGVDAAIDADPHDRFALVEPVAVERAAGDQASADRPAARVLERQAPPPRAPGDGPPLAADALIRQAQEIAASARTLDELRTLWEAFDGCALATTAQAMIFAGGNAKADIMIIGAAPGSDDERQSEAFAGPAGRLVDGMLRAIGRSRDSAYMTNVIPWRPPGNRPPTPLEAALCLPFTRRHIALADPAFILCLGERAAQLLLDTKDSMARLRGRWLTYEGDATTVKVAVTFSLDYLLSQPLQKKRAWLDLLNVAKMLETTAAIRPRSQ
jgi:uracil-DNA glycosylase family 4